MAEPFEHRPKPREGLVSRVLGGGAQAGTIAEIEGLLADAARVRDVPAEHVRQIAVRHGVDFEARLLPARRNLYRRLLEHCVLDGAVSPEENAELSHLKGILGLADADVAPVHEDVARAAYGQALAQALEDHRIDPDERAFLARLQSDLHLDSETAERLQQKEAEDSRQRFLSRSLTYDNVLVSTRAKLELSGSSDKSLDDAIREAVEKAGRAVPNLASAEVESIRIDVEDGRVARWHVQLRASLRGPE
jgi:hypothetical protein